MSVPQEWQQAWLNPRATDRGAPFWSWNDKLSPERLGRQIEQMNRAGLGGFFMHSRYGLKTPYLSSEWFECVKACIEKARELDMKAYLYDEDRWPSGTAGGKVTREHPEYGQHFLAVVRPEHVRDPKQVLATFAMDLADGRCRRYRMIDAPSAAKPGELVLAFEARRTEPSPWHNDAPYLDTMNPAAVAQYIRDNHQPYADRFGKDFGPLVPAIFTDEPNYGFAWKPGQDVEHHLVWTPAMPTEFIGRRGYDLIKHLPELVAYGQDDEFSRVRHDFYRTAAELFVEAFTAQIAAWCGRNNIAMTGHMLWEGRLDEQIAAVGSCMPHYEHMQWPGIDILTDQARELLTAKQCTSVASQLGKERVLSELYGCTGWDWPLEGHKFIGDWQYAAGVNLRCPHLTHYSLAGGAKRDYPASIYAHSPWWPYYRAVEDYFGRVGYMLTRGQAVRDVLVIHPIESAWGMFIAAQRKVVRRLCDQLKEVIFGLSGQHYDWDFADESLLARHGRVSGATLRVGQMRYRAVVVPPALTLRSSTVRILRRFADRGGKVLVLGEGPLRVDGKASKRLQPLLAAATRCGQEAQQFVPELAKALDRRVSITENGQEQTQMWYMLRSVKGGQLLFIQSHDRKAAHTVRVRAAGRRPVVDWDPQTGRRRRLKADQGDGYVEFDLSLSPTGSALLSLGLSVREASPPGKAARVLKTQQLGGPFDIELVEPNTLPLDYCQWAVGEGQFSQPVPVLKADETIRGGFGLSRRDNGAQQPWYLYAAGHGDTAPRGPVRMRWTFHVTQPPSRCHLAVEHPERFVISVNGRVVSQVAGYWVDEDIKTLDIASALRQGDNEILLSFNYQPDMELEDMYLVGDFGVRNRQGGPHQPGSATLIAPPRRLGLGSWVGQGLDFYGGAVRYRLNVDRPPGKRVRLRLEGVECAAAVIHAGGKPFILPWAPFEAEITEALADGPNEVTVEVIGGRHNIMGPLHTPQRAWVGPGEFDPHDKEWTPQYLLHDHGLTQPVTVEILA